MSDYVSLSGVVQQFGDKEVVIERETKAGVMHDFTIRTTGNQKLVRVSVFPELGQAATNLSAGDGVFVDGAYEERTQNGTTYCNLTARTIAPIPVAPKIASATRAATKTASF